MPFLKTKINPVFFLITFSVPLLIFGFLALFAVFILVAPFVNLRVSSVFANPVVPQEVRRLAGFSDFAFSELSKEASSSASAFVKNVPATFSLTIPKLRINYAQVETNSKNLSPDNLLGHYSGTSLPGDKGNAFIYGHSALPVFYNPKDYKTIFSTLGDLESGDRFYIDFGERFLTYEVVEKSVLLPSEVKIYEPSFVNLSKDDSSVTLMTCVPAGTKLYRLLVTGKLVTSN